MNAALYNQSELIDNLMQQNAITGDEQSMNCIKAITAKSEQFYKNPHMKLTDMAKNASECHDVCEALLKRAKENNAPDEIIEVLLYLVFL